MRHVEPIQEKFRTSDQKTWGFAAHWIQNIKHLFRSIFGSNGSLEKFKKSYRKGNSRTMQEKQWYNNIGLTALEIIGVSRAKSDIYSKMRQHIEDTYFWKAYSSYQDFSESTEVLESNFDDFDKPFKVAELVDKAIEDGSDEVINENPELAKFFAMKHGYDFLTTVDDNKYCGLLFYATVKDLQLRTRSAPGVKDSVFDNIDEGFDAVEQFVGIILTNGIIKGDISERFLPITNPEIMNFMLKMIVKITIHLRLVEKVSGDAMESNYWAVQCACAIDKLVYHPYQIACEQKEMLNLQRDLELDSSIGLSSKSIADEETVDELIEFLGGLLKIMDTAFPEHESIILKVRKEAKKTIINDEDYE